MQKIAANKLLVDKDTLINNGVVVRDDSKVIEATFSLDDCVVETANTVFLNGLITTYILERNRIVGESVRTLITENLCAGYSGRLLLWKSIDLETLILTSKMEVIEI
ncbi:MAG: hypothetical protein PHH23_02495 [Paludibacteraceae bacterium]|jgi:hypothetical protein|nr:hypothetical protein [Paludibacteraceae bacterium]